MVLTAGLLKEGRQGKEEQEGDIKEGKRNTEKGVVF